MNKNTSQEIPDINGLIAASKSIKTKLIIEEKKSVEPEKIDFKKESKDKVSIYSPLMDKKFQNFMPSYIPINTLSDMSNNFNLNSNNALITSNEMKGDKKENEKNNFEGILENGLNLDEKKIISKYIKFDNAKNIVKNEQKEKNEINNNIKNIKSNNEIKYINENNTNDSKTAEAQKQKDKLPFGIQIPKELFDKIEYAIDENGNPFNIKQTNDDSPTKKPVALIIQKGNKADNYLIDLQGNKISKMEDGYFNYQHNNTRIIIKDFDVQHPELRIYGTRNKDILLLNDTDKKEKNDDSNKINNKDIKKYEIVLNKKILHLKHNSPVRIRNRKNENDTKNDKRIDYDLNKNKKIFKSKKLIPKSNPSSTALYPIKKFSNNYALNRTSNILNKGSSNISYHNRSYTISNSSNNILINKNDYSNSSICNEINRLSVTPSREIKQVTCVSSRINLYNYKRNHRKEGSFSNFNKAINLKNMNILHRNSQSLSSLPSYNFEDDVKVNNYNSLRSNKKSIRTDFNSIQSNNIKKSKSSNNIVNTINNISNKIKYIQNKINNNTTKITSIPTISNISTNNSQINNINNNFNTVNSFSYMNQLKNNSSLHKIQYKCAILSKEVNDIISNYSNTNNTIEKNQQNGYNNKMYEITINKNRINSFLNGYSMINNLASQRNKNNYSTVSTYFNKDILHPNNISNDNTNIDNCGLCGKSILNRIKSQSNNTHLQNGFINFRRRKINSLSNINNNVPNFYTRPIISENYIHNINLMNKNRNNRNRLNFIASRNSLSNFEENKSLTTLTDFFGENKNNNNLKYNFS